MWLQEQQVECDGEREMFHQGFYTESCRHSSLPLGAVFHQKVDRPGNSQKQKRKVASPLKRISTSIFSPHQKAFHVSADSRCGFRRVFTRIIQKMKATPAVRKTDSGARRRPFRSRSRISPDSDRLPCSLILPHDTACTATRDAQDNTGG